jgi:opacity protein-like surface antigen
MGSLKKLALSGAVATLAPIGAALAADMPGAYYETPAPYEFASGWYLRGDIGYKWYATPNASFDVPGYGNMIGESLSNTGVGGIGFGYRFSDYVRSDFTLDYEWPGNFKGRLRCPSPCTGASDPEYSTEYADISAWTGLINAYVDIGEYGGFTPYVGAGIGASYLTTSDVHYLNPNGSTGTWKGTGTWNFAWAVMAGASYAFSKNWLVDLSYRYVDLGDAKSGKTLPAFGNQHIKYDDISAQEVRIGFRYLLN